MEELLFYVCEAENAGTYLNALDGMDIYDKKQFSENDLELHFAKKKFRKYRQFSDEFIAGLSIIEVMMFNSQEVIAEMLNDFELI